MELIGGHVDGSVITPSGNSPETQKTIGQKRVSADLIRKAALSCGPNDPPSTAVSCDQNWIEIQYISSIPKNMPTHMETAELKPQDLKPAEDGMKFVITDAEQKQFRREAVIQGNEAVRVPLPKDVDDVLFTFEEDDRPSEMLGVPEAEMPGEEEEGWVEGIARGVVSGTIKGINGVLMAIDDLSDWIIDVAGIESGFHRLWDSDGTWNPHWVTKAEYKAERAAARERGEASWLAIPNIDPPKSRAGQIAEGVAKFLVAFFPAVRGVRMLSGGAALTGTGQLAQYTLAAVVVDASVFGPHEKRLSDLIQQFPELQNPVTEYLASDPKDSNAEGRLKNVLEGLLAGAVAHVAVQGVGAGARGMARAGRAVADKTPQARATLADGFVRALRVIKYGTSRVVVKLKPRHRYVFESETLKDVVGVLLRAARKAEPRARALVEKIAARTQGVLKGLDFRVKGEGSLSTKIAKDAADEGEIYSVVAVKIRDVLRFTIAYPEESYARSVAAAMKELEAEGYKVVRLKNFWLKKPGVYKGINTVVEMPNGYHFELQFHTGKSYWAKEEGTHSILEEMRKYPKKHPRYDELNDEQAKVFQTVQSPPGAKDIAEIDRL